MEKARLYAQKHRIKAGQSEEIMRVCLRCDRKYYTWKGFRRCKDCRKPGSQFGVDFRPYQHKFKEWVPNRRIRKSVSRPKIVEAVANGVTGQALRDVAKPGPKRGPYVYVKKGRRITKYAVGILNIDDLGVTVQETRMKIPALIGILS